MEFYKLTGRERLRVISLADVPGEEEQEVETCRMAMLARNEAPANTSRVIQLLHLPKRRYDDYIKPFVEQLRCHIEYTEEGGAVIQNVVPTDEKDDKGNVVYELGDLRVDIRPVLGRDRRKFIIKTPSDFVKLLPEFTGLSAKELNALPIALHSGATTSLAFLAGFLETENG